MDKNLQLEHNDIEFERRKYPIVVLCDNLRTPQNIAMVFRLADAFGVEKIILSDKSPDPSNKTIKKHSRETVRNIDNKVVGDLVGEALKYKNRGYKLICLEITSNSLPIQKIELSQRNKYLLVIGSERNGIQEGILKLSDQVVHIPMYGDNTSMNVVHSLGIMLYEMTNQINDEE
jgi:23S rRNA (guanosine2251-2'-O)-methyltransferase